MVRFGFKMRLRGPEVVGQYEAIHCAVDAEVLAAHTKCGILNYSIFRDGLLLFACFEAEDPEAAIVALSKEEVMKGWWSRTNPLMAVDEANQPEITRLPEIFHME
jgi:L-rhamnose mutarotase